MKIFDSRKNIVVASVGVLLVALTLVSCEKRDDYYVRGDNSYSETIGFSIVDPMAQTRNHRGLAKVDNEAIEYKTVLRSNDSSDSLHLTTYVSDINLPQNLMTRASAFTISNLSDFTVYGYNSTAQTFDYGDNFISAGIAKKQTDGTWRFDPDVNWPAGNSNFFAIANNGANSGVTISAGDNVRPTLNYIVPTEVGNHKDVVVARSGIQASNTALVPLNFQHIFTSVEFKFEDIASDAGGQIHSISIEDIYTNGSLNLAYESELGFMASRAWSYNGDKETFTLPLGDNMNITKDNNDQSIGTLDNGYAIMMIPQTLDGAKLKIEYTPTGSETRITMYANLIGTWSAGKRVSYAISIARIIDLWFNNTTEICLDAHYVMSSVLDIHIGDDVSGNWTLSVPNDCDWLKFQTDSRTDFTVSNNELSDLQKDGWWIIDDVNEKATKTLSSRTKGESLKVVLVATENPSNENRSTTITLSSGETSKPYTITQMCPHWITTESGKTIGAERIEEYPGIITLDGVSHDYSQSVPWGPYWKSNSTDGNGNPLYEITYDATVMDLLEQAIAWAWQLFVGDENVTENKKYGFYTESYTFDLSNVVSGTVTGTADDENGLSNTSSGYTTVQQNISQFEQFLKDAGSSPTEEPTFETIDPIYTAFLSSLQKNAIKRGKLEGEDVYFADVDNSEINWYLPAVKEAASGVYQENAEAHACETSFLNNGVGKVYWTSTSVDAEHAYTYKYGSTITDASQQKDATYHVRAIRRSTTTN